MEQTPLLESESSAFAVIPGEGEETNPGIYGKALAQWLAGQLRAAGFSPGEVIAEDFGWCVPVEMARLLGKDKSAESLAALFTALRRCLESAPIVRGLREEA